MDDDAGAPGSKQKDAPKEEPVDSSPMKPAPSGSARGTPSTTKSSKAKRKLNEETKASNGAPAKKVKTENVCNCFCEDLHSRRNFKTMLFFMNFLHTAYLEKLFPHTSVEYEQQS